MDSRRFSMNYGAVLGLFLISIALIMWILGINEQQSVIPSILNNIIIIGFLVYAIIIYRDNYNSGFISYSESLKLGTSVAFFSSIIMAFYSFIYIMYLEPDMLNEVLKTTEQAVLQTNPEVSEEELELALNMTSKLFQPHWLMIMSVLSGTFMGFFFSTIISFFVKKNDLNQIS
tara:strand:- start:176 stop:697 length:522 start_codon:yes stop_codon:yes gene_type:complete